ncbi:hypothetical protein FVF58_38795 [Paraburkholderia panacisoli]|jgi:hypothetical protein|uniref:Uncharacterized protein n=1 Tax=Paraburkholderia panacisoli TaxID=2603818 RepID=A0A5B0GGT6_9BURK|nr:hypothetical protein [Paraburkholderia panacisoli]KAA1001758.1 hypothetical protein FVF58_38795 [Paraburkholderia panacisoli]
MYKLEQYHPGVLAVLFSELICLAAFAWETNAPIHNKWVEVLLGFSLLSGLILSLGFFGTWLKFKDEVKLNSFLSANPIYSAIAIATLGEVATILLVPTQ